MSSDSAIAESVSCVEDKNTGEESDGALLNEAPNGQAFDNRHTGPSHSENNVPLSWLLQDHLHSYI